MTVGTTSLARISGAISNGLAWTIRVPIHLYRWVVSPLLGPRCRFAPSCSEYALQSLSRHGPFRGGWLAFRRITRCHPWGGSGFDPVPPKRTAA